MFVGLLYLFDVPTFLSSLTNFTQTYASPSLGQVGRTSRYKREGSGPSSVSVTSSRWKDHWGSPVQGRHASGYGPGTLGWEHGPFVPWHWSIFLCSNEYTSIIVYIQVKICAQICHLLLWHLVTFLAVPPFDLLANRLQVQEAGGYFLFSKLFPWLFQCLFISHVWGPTCTCIAY